MPCVGGSRPAAFSVLSDKVLFRHVFLFAEYGGGRSRPAATSGALTVKRAHGYPHSILDTSARISTQYLGYKRTGIHTVSWIQEHGYPHSILDTSTRVSTQYLGYKHTGIQAHGYQQAHGHPLRVSTRTGIHSEHPRARYPVKTHEHLDAGGLGRYPHTRHTS